MAGSGTGVAFALIQIGMLEGLFLYCISIQQNTICHAHSLKMSLLMSISQQSQADSARLAPYPLLDIIHDFFSILNFISESEISRTFGIGVYS